MPETRQPDGKPAVLIIGGLGYIGRYLALHIHQNSLASEIRLVDKQLPELAYLAPEFKEACSRDKFMQADASREQALDRIFSRPAPNSTTQFDYVLNCGGETRFSQEDEVYKARSYTLSLTLGRECAKRRIPVYLECSTGMVYKPDSSPSTESSKLKPWLKLAVWKAKAEEDLGRIEGLNLCVLRFANVYGPYVTKFLGTALCMARVYQSEEEAMEWLWGKELRTNTVHVEDAARAMWAACEWYVGKKKKGKPVQPVPVFNVVDHGKTSQGMLATIINSVFCIPTGFQGTLVSSFARMNLDSVVDEINNDMLDPWAELQERAELTPGPLGPFVEKELLKDTDLSLDGAAFEKETGFKYLHDRLTEKEVREVVESYKRMGWWP